MAWGPFGQGDIDVVGHPLLQSLAAKYQKTASQIVLRWIVQRGLITIPRAKLYARPLTKYYIEHHHQDEADGKTDGAEV